MILVDLEERSITEIKCMDLSLIIKITADCLITEAETAMHYNRFP